MSRPPADPVARWLALIVRHHLVTNAAERPDLPELPEGVIWVQGHVVGELETGIVVTMADRRVRFFLVRVAEFRHPLD